ncbi:hypothetical protein E8E12_007078 [Didymella heteroderae]|uniref:Heterokaryon incompatibility domain-containing protein n=1 Tax=Didymella heteroderae TaxID=1769908 RepID=A0A9P4X0R3_9PLEO|nr:hypothetical protein E8E12_007078 [Didymella heteroderae]
MSLHPKLARELATLELQCLSNLSRQNDEVLREVDHISTLREDGPGGAFEKSMRIKRMIDDLEAKVQTEPSWTALAALLRSEYRLWKLNVETDIRVNPFLSHWVEVILKLHADTQGYQPVLEDDDGDFGKGALSCQDIAAARLEMLKELLKYGEEALTTATPRSLYITRFPPKPFDIRPFIRMLEEEGIYEPRTAPTPPPNLTVPSKVADMDPGSPGASSVGTPVNSSTDLTYKPAPPTLGLKWKESILLNLETDPPLAVHQLTHLPLAITALDFLTTLITASKLATHGIDPKSVVLSFVQHALRIIEYARQPPDPASESPLQTDIGVNTYFGYGRDAQIWAVRVLLLFVKNLIQKGCVDVYPNKEYTLYYDIQEICTQAHVDGKYQLVNDTSVTVSINGHHATADQKAYQLVFSCGPLKRENDVTEKATEDAAVSWLAVEADGSSPAAEIIAPRPLTKHSSSEQTFSLIKSWATSCVDGHEKCQLGYTYEELQNAGEADDEPARLRAKYSEEDVKLPTRLIDVGFYQDDVRLVESASFGDRGKYLALSHVWGKTKHFKTESINLDEHRTKILFDDLPKTFRDAVLVTRALGLRYLWIDSLCIIQDSPMDWEREASRMASVYMNAYATISAAASENSDGGLFFNREPPECSAELTYTSPSGTVGLWTIHNKTPSFDQQVRHTTLASRAWCLQEKQLARRTLHFGSYQVIFECKERYQYETQRPSDKLGEGRLNIQMLYWMLVGFRGRNDIVLKQLVGSVLTRTWLQIVEDYTKRKLTFESDKLPALHGLAQYVIDLTRDQYLFGLWKSSLDLGLLWRTAPYENISERRGRVADRAPSWSWASVDGRVYFAFVGEKPLEIGTARITEVVEITTDGMLVMDAQIVSLRRGKLNTGDQWELKQFTRAYSYMSTAEKRPPMVAYEWVRGMNHEWFGWVAVDIGTKFEDDETQQQDVEALLMREQVLENKVKTVFASEPFKKSYLVLLVRKAEDGENYQRIGMGQIFACEDMDQAEKSRVRII